MKNSFHKVTFNLISELKLLNHLQILYKKVRKLSLSPRPRPPKPFSAKAGRSATVQLLITEQNLTSGLQRTKSAFCLLTIFWCSSH